MRISESGLMIQTKDPNSETQEVFDLFWFWREENGATRIESALEVGVSESAADLTKHATGWIKSDQYLSFLVVKIAEQPRYQSPKWDQYDAKKQEYQDLRNLCRGDGLGELASRITLKNPNNPFDGMEIMGIKFMGKLEAYVEIWKPDSNGEPQSRRYVCHAILIFCSASLKLADSNLCW